MDEIEEGARIWSFWSAKIRKETILTTEMYSIMAST